MKIKYDYVLPVSLIAGIIFGVYVPLLKPEKAIKYSSNKNSLENTLINTTLEKAKEDKPVFHYTPEELIKFDTWIDSTLAQSARDSSNSIIVNKKERLLYLIKNGKVDSKYPIDLGFNPYDDKQVEGDGCTPEGRYLVEKKLHGGNTNFYKAFLINYPNEEDRKKGKTGGLIEIHGEGLKGSDWTLGCMAPSNENMDKIFPFINEGDKVTIVRHTSKELLSKTD